MTVDDTEKEASVDSSVIPGSVARDCNNCDPLMASIEEEFQIAADYVQKLPKQGPYKPSKETKLLLYGWYKQATVGECTTSRPGFFKFLERPKWQAWHDLGKMSKEEAMESYVKEFKRLKAKFDDAAGTQGS